jgi:hypothetical protein
MIPPGAFIGLFFVIRMLANRGKKTGSVPTVKASATISWWASLWWIFGAGWSVYVAVMVLSGAWYEAPLLALLLTITFPWWTARYVLAPLGLARTAGVVTWMARVLWFRDASGGAATAAALALLHRKRANPAVEAMIHRWLGDQRPVKAGGALACALLAVGRGDFESARALMIGISEMDKRVRPALAAKLADEWLALDAAEQGNWAAVQNLTTRAGPKTRLSRFLREVAFALGRTSRKYGQARLLFWFLLAPRRRHTLALFKRAWSVGPPEEKERSVESPQDPLSHALTLHAGGLQNAAELDPAGLRQLGSAWDVALAHPETAALLLKRAADLGVSDPGDATGRLRSAAADDVAAMVRNSRVEWLSLQGSSELLAQAGQDAREEQLSAIELAAERLNDRVKLKRALPVLSELQEYATIRRAYERAVESGGPEARHLLFTQIYNPVCNQAVWLFNERAQKAIANGMLKWLLREAEAVGDVEAIRLQTKNVAAGCGVAQ